MATQVYMGAVSSNSSNHFRVLGFFQASLRLFGYDRYLTPFLSTSMIPALFNSRLTNCLVLDTLPPLP